MILVFGDSFAKIFTLIKKKVMIVNSYKGATIKGLMKPNNKNRLDIENKLKNSKCISHVIFTFGQVDLNLSFYYDLCKNLKIINPTETLPGQYNKLINEYISWISAIPGHFKRIVIMIYPSPLNQINTINSLVNYGSFTQEEIRTHNVILQFYANDLFRKCRYFEVVYALNKLCGCEIQQNFKKYKQQNIRLVNINKYLLDGDLNVKQEYLDVNPHGMHVRWGPTLPHLITELIAVDVPIKHTDVIEDIMTIEAEYIKQKIEKIKSRGINVQTNV